MGGYDIGASYADSTSMSLPQSAGLSSGTVFNFGLIGGGVGQSANASADAIAKSEATATTKSPGTTNLGSTSSDAVGSLPMSQSSGMGMEKWLLIGGAALLAVAYFVKK